MSQKMTYENITKAIDAELIIWRENQKSAISTFDLAKEIPVFNNMPDVFKVATWFGLGMTAAEKLTPLTAAATLASRTAGPLAILKLAGDYFAKEYTQKMNANRLQLENNSRHYTNKLRDSIDQASRDFYNPGMYGDLLTKKLLTLSENDLFKDSYQIKLFLDDVLVKSKVIISSNAIIGDQTRAAMGKLAQVTEAIYKGSKYAQGTGVHMLKASNSSGPFSSNDFKHSQCHASKHILVNAKKGQKIGYLLADSRTPMSTVVHQAGDKFDYIDSDTVLNDVLLNAWRYEARHEEGGFLSGYYQCKTTWIWPAIDAVENLDLNMTYQGSLLDVETNYNKLRSQYIVN